MPSVIHRGNVPGHTFPFLRRKSFGNCVEKLDIPYLISVQKESYHRFLQPGVSKKERLKIGLENVFRSMFPIKGAGGSLELIYKGYTLEPCKNDPDECVRNDLWYNATIKIDFSLASYSISGEKTSFLSSKMQEVFMGEIPMMTDHGTFIIKGSERVVVSQLQRSPGVFFDHDGGKSNTSGRVSYLARIIPYRGSWFDIECDSKDHLYMRVDRHKKVPLTTFLQSYGLTRSKMMHLFHDITVVKHEKTGWIAPFSPILRQPLPFDIIDAKSKKKIGEKDDQVTPEMLHTWKKNRVEKILLQEEMLKDFIVTDDIVLGEVKILAGLPLGEEGARALLISPIKSISLIDPVQARTNCFIGTLTSHQCESRNEALKEVYQATHPGDSSSLDVARDYVHNLFSNSDYYDLSEVGRVKLNKRLKLDCPETEKTLRQEDLIAIVQALVKIRNGQGRLDDIDSLANRRVRSVGELLENRFSVALSRMERNIKERMTNSEHASVKPVDLINSKIFNQAMREFFSLSQFSQLVDQTNPLSEVTHKRRLSALGPGGLTRERAGFEARDVHPTHYGRICTIETPEGQNTGLINSLSVYAGIDKYGFIETCYRKVNNGKLMNDFLHLNAVDEIGMRIAQAKSNISPDGTFSDEFVPCRIDGDFEMTPRKKVDYIDVSPKQIVSVAASLIPFLENDDANRALMGSNMQRQAVPLVRSQAPLVGTGMEKIVAVDAEAVICAKNSGVVDQVDASRIVLRNNEDDEPSKPVDIYNMVKFRKTNQSTIINQTPLVRQGQSIKKGDILADGSSTDRGELALGANVLVAFMPWHGYNFEDSILISERLVRDDIYTSIHVEDFEIQARDTRQGSEVITRDIPNVGEESLRHLDDSGIVHVGAEVNSGDVLVGKVEPKGEILLSPEEKLLRSIFGDQASDMKDRSFRVPSGVSGVVVDVQVFTRRGIDKDERTLLSERQEIADLEKDEGDSLSIIKRNVYSRLEELLLKNEAEKGPSGVQKDRRLSQSVLSSLKKDSWWDILLKDKSAKDKMKKFGTQYKEQIKIMKQYYRDRRRKVEEGIDLTTGVLKQVKIYIATRRKIQPGDKMAGRHGNKGVISRICPLADMPFLEDGTPVDIVLNPLGVTSRMNVGQILETHMGWACVGMGKKIGRILESYEKHEKTKEKDKYDKKMRSLLSDLYGKKADKLSSHDMKKLAYSLRHGVPIETPVFDGAQEEDIKGFLTMSDLDESGQVSLYDGQTGELFHRKVTVGYSYMLKLHHLVDDKIHARSVGSYSLVTQQPLGGRAHFGGQRLGEMEVWGLQAYGAAYTLREMLTIKSDDVAGRGKAYNAIINGEDTFETGIPESFNVLVKEMQALSLDVQEIPLHAKIASGKEIEKEKKMLTPEHLKTRSISDDSRSLSDSTSQIEKQEV